MNTLTRLLGSLVVGIVSLLAVLVAVTELLAPYVWPSLMVGVPAGVVAGVAAAVLSFTYLTVRDERRERGELSARTRRFAAASVGGVAGFVGGGVLASAATFATGGVGLASAMLFVGFPTSLVAAAAGAVVGWLAGRDGGGRVLPSSSTPR